MFYIWLVSNGRLLLLLLPASVSHGTVSSYHKVECLIAVTYLSREKTFAKFEVLWLFTKFSPQNLKHGVFWHGTSKLSCTSLQKFSSQKFPTMW